MMLKIFQSWIGHLVNRWIKRPILYIDKSNEFWLREISQSLVYPYIVISNDLCYNVQYRMEKNKYRVLNKKQLYEVINNRARIHAPKKQMNFVISANKNVFNFWYWHEPELRKRLLNYSPYEVKRIIPISLVREFAQTKKGQVSSYKLVDINSDGKNIDSLSFYSFKDQKSDGLEYQSYLNGKLLSMISVLDDNDNEKQRLFIRTQFNLVANLGKKLLESKDIIIPTPQLTKLSIRKIEKANIFSSYGLWRNITRISFALSLVILCLIIFTIGQLSSIGGITLYNKTRLSFTRENQHVENKTVIDKVAKDQIAFLRSFNNQKEKAGALHYYLILKTIADEYELKILEFSISELRGSISIIGGASENIVNFGAAMEAKSFFTHIAPIYNNKTNVTRFNFEIMPKNYNQVLKSSEKYKQ